jgi:hypothetical protein
MISAQQLRQLQTENDAQRAERKAQRDAEFKPRFQEACLKYKAKLLEEVSAALAHIRDKRLNYKYIMLDYKNITTDTDGFAYSTMLYGFWNKEKKEFDESIFSTNDTEKPFDAAVKELAELGYKLENVSDASKSKRLYIKLSW